MDRPFPQINGRCRRTNIFGLHGEAATLKGIARYLPPLHVPAKLNGSLIRSSDCRKKIWV